MTKEDTDNTVEQRLKYTVTAAGRLVPSDNPTNIRGEIVDLYLLYDAARELLTLKEQIAAGKIAIVPVDPTEKMKDGTYNAYFSDEYDFVEARNMIWETMLSATPTYDWSKGGFND